MKINNIFCYIGTLIIVQLFAFSAYSACSGLSLDGVTASSSFQGGGYGYVVYDTNEYIKEVNFNVSESANSESCDYFVVLNSGQSGNENQRIMSSFSSKINYNAYVDPSKNNVLKECSSASNSEVISGIFPASPSLGQSKEHSFYWSITPQQVVNPSIYSDNGLTMSLYDGTVGSVTCGSIADSATISFNATVQSMVNLSLVSSGAGFNIADTTQAIDFGDLESAERQGFDLVIRSNHGYLVTMQSTNGQALRHANYPTIYDEIKYNLTINGGLVNLSSGNQVQVISNHAGTTTANGISFPIQVTVGNVPSSISAGSYSDIIAITINYN